jgi:hypothetical protein
MQIEFYTDVVGWNRNYVRLNRDNWERTAGLGRSFRRPLLGVGNGANGQKKTASNGFILLVWMNADDAHVIRAVSENIDAPDGFQLVVKASCLLASVGKVPIETTGELVTCASLQTSARCSSVMMNFSTFPAEQTEAIKHKHAVSSIFFIVLKIG